MATYPMSTPSPNKLRLRRRRQQHVTVELISHSEVARLEACDDALRAEIAQLQKQLDANRALLYEFMSLHKPDRRR